jgi:hypothetical protein
MKKVLVVYYSQSGQLTQIVKNVVKPLQENTDITIDFEQVIPEKDYPFPWGAEFFDCFPESVKCIPCPLKPFKFDPVTNYDLIIIALQSWYLSPSIPMNSFLMSNEASVLLKDKKVITLYGVRNMWTITQEIVKKRLHDLNAILVGNIVLCDKSNNYIAGLTITRWLVYGKKDSTLLLPEAGVSKKDIVGASKFGEIINQSLLNNQFYCLQNKLVESGAVPIKFHLICIELTARKIFNKFALFILKKGEAGNPSRGSRVRLFKYYIFFVFFALQPIVSFIYILNRYVFFPVVNRKIQYYKDIKLKN